MCCISYYSYIKPQRGCHQGCSCYVVYRTIPTSNHNITALMPYTMIVVYRTIPTSNHNPKVFFTPAVLLYIVLFLHQTTTYSCCDYPLHSCISYYSYIKPQLQTHCFCIEIVVYRTIPTSNHNGTGM